MIIKPKRFVGLHAHSTLSVGDAIGLPQEHIDYAISNGMDGLALTDHGSMAGISHQQLHLKKLEAKGIKFKAIPGVEAYFIDSLSDWSKLLQVQKANKQLQKAMANNTIGNELADTEADMDAKHGKELSEEEEGGTVVEIEAESKNNKFSDPIAQRNHLVLLPKNNAGLKSLFQIVSESYIDGFYRYPRIDLDILKRHTKGNLVATSACIGGRLARTIFDNQDQTVDWKDWGVNRHNYTKIMTELKAVTERFVDVLGGPENYYLELQMNRLNCVIGTATLLTNNGLRTMQQVVEDVKNGIEVSVLSYDEAQHKCVFRRVSWGDLTRKNAKVIKITLANGATLTLTPDHKVFTNLGWIAAGDLKNHPAIEVLSNY
jgi:DNA polymerase III alpha subunit